MDWAIVASLLTALGAGSVLTKVIGDRAERRRFRSEVLHAISKVEAGRWAPEVAAYRNFMEIVRGLEVSALLAQLPREPVQQYKRLSVLAWRLSDESYVARGGDEDGGAGSINADFGAKVNESAALLIELAWRPIRGRVNLRRRMQAIDRAVASLAQTDGDVRRVVGYATIV